MQANRSNTSKPDLNRTRARKQARERSSRTIAAFVPSQVLTAQHIIHHNPSERHVDGARKRWEGANARVCSLLREDQDSRKGSCTDSGPSVPNWKSQSSCPTLHRDRQERGAAELHDRCRSTCPGTQGIFRESLDWGIQL